MEGATTHKKKVSNSSHIPDDIAFSILSKLPIKSLKRFICVKKSWSLLFQNPHFMDMFRMNFISTNDNDNDEDTTCLLLMQRQRRDLLHSLFILSGERFEDRVRLDWPPPFQGNGLSVEILGSASVNGILCLSQGHDDDVTTILWNPATKEFKIIPPSLQPYFNIELTREPQGFGYDSIRDDYKIIRYTQFPFDFVPKKDSCNWDGDNDDTLWEEQISKIYDQFWELYSLRNNCWKKLHGANLPEPWPGRSHVNLNEFCHWLEHRHHIVSFDFHNEIFFVTPYPSLDFSNETSFVASGRKHYWMETYLAVLNRSVAFIYTIPMTATFCIWILGELGVKESWTKLFIVGPLPCLQCPIGVGKKSVIFYVKEDMDGYIKENMELAMVDLRTQTIEDIGYESEFYSQKILIYKENFLPFGGMNN